MGEIMTTAYIIAHEYRHAKYLFDFVLKQEGVSRFSHPRTSDELRGLQRGTEVIIVEAPRYVATQRQRDTRRELVELSYARDFKIKRVRLP